MSRCPSCKTSRNPNEDALRLDSSHCSLCVTIYYCEHCQLEKFALKDRDACLYLEHAEKVIEQCCAECIALANCPCCVITGDAAKSDKSKVLICSSCGVRGVSCVKHEGLSEVPEGDWFCGMHCVLAGAAPERILVARREAAGNEDSLLPSRPFKKRINSDTASSSSPSSEEDKHEKALLIRGKNLLFLEMGKLAVDFLTASREYSFMPDNEEVSERVRKTKIAMLNKFEDNF